MRCRLVGFCTSVLLALVAVGGAGSAEGAPGSRPEHLERHRQIVAELDAALSAVNALKVPGYVVGVTGAGVGNFERAAGVAAPGQPMSLDDHFRIASISKTFTATLILELVDRGVLHLDDLLAKWEPLVPNASKITIRMLLNMTSGIWDEGGTSASGQPSSLSQWIAANCAPPAAQCGEYWEPQQLVDLAIQDSSTYGPASPVGDYYYSDTNYAILGIIAQKVMHQPLEALLRRFVLGPLGLQQTSFPTHDVTIPAPAAAGHDPVGNASGTLLRYELGPILSPSALFGAGNGISTLHDLEVWARALTSGTLLKPQTQQQRLDLLGPIGGFVPLADTGVNDELPVGYGLGIAGAGGMFGHNGVMSPPGFTSEMWELPRQRGTVVVLLNSITPCQVTGGGAELLSDALSTTLAQIAFGPLLQTVPAPGLATCPVPIDASPAG